MSLANALQSVIARGAALPTGSAAALQRSLEKFAGAVSEQTLDELIAAVFEGVRDSVKPKSGEPGAGSGNITR